MVCLCLCFCLCLSRLLCFVSFSLLFRCSVFSLPHFVNWFHLIHFSSRRCVSYNSHVCLLCCCCGLWRTDAYAFAVRLYRKAQQRMSAPTAGGGGGGGVTTGPTIWLLLTYRYVADIETRRIPYRTQHLAHSDRYRTSRGGCLWLGGAFASPVDGAMLVFEFPANVTPHMLLSSSSPDTKSAPATNNTSLSPNASDRIAALIAHVEAFVTADPYNKNGLIESYSIREWTLRKTGESPPPSRPAALTSKL